ncbi:ABC transporter substrate-binding protein [Cohaesibacter sp. CAU 1516]|uniref:CmpA/NrtA family ABC transporter substrate-binding protein n=1 Tax=Cohaesibacter sp. CAU 1516 TaxID=2576038 RepID=UPI0010FCE97F|nr:CmpA/NrtA family ABC transporter substrate-binding protein [Cohaesibacter sp. CAU 1516]TLP44898.1 ABC transporter substrate-binding protein [Cohaesibacter sp. CAU 1516]
MTSKATHIQAGYIALNDAAPLIIARECGFAEAEGIDLHLHKETSWATLRDKLAIGLFDVAHLLAPISVAASCKLFPLPLDIVVPMALGLGGNMVTMARSIWDGHAPASGPVSFDAGAAGARLKAMIKDRRARGNPKLRLGAVHPYSAHNYELRYWLAGCGIDPDQDTDIVFLPPSTMPDALRSGALDAFCVGEPWNSAAILDGDGVLLTTKGHIWQNSPDKVLGVRRSFALDQQEAHYALLRALYKAAEWIESPANKEELCRILSAPGYIGLSETRLKPGFNGAIKTGLTDPERLNMPDFYLPLSRAALFPKESHALWFYSQMVRWGHVELSDDHIARVRASCHPEMLRAALAPLDIALPDTQQDILSAQDIQSPIASDQGLGSLGPDVFFDRIPFDPDALAAYVAGQRVSKN